MRLLRLNVENFRNIEFASVEFGASSHFLLGANGQGKTNLLEAIGLVSALRSFRTSETRPLIRHGASAARLYFEVEQESGEMTGITLTFRSGAKEILEGVTVITRLADFIGRVPSVVLSSSDLELLRGAPNARRRLLDLLLASTDPDYFQAIRRYHQGLRERNALLRDARPNPNILDAFDRTLAPDAVRIIAARREALSRLREHLVEAYQVICPVDEAPDMLYRPSASFDSTEACLEAFAASRERDRILHSTQVGPHRDDWRFRLNGKNAREFASEGQQRGLVVSLRLAQIAYLRHVTGVAPLVLADDVLGELDPVRREGFWRAVAPDLQIIATGTSAPAAVAGRSWHLHLVQAGKFEPQNKN